MNKLSWAALTLAAALLRLPAATNAIAQDVRRDATVLAIERVMPAVVNIRTETVVERPADPMDQ